MKLRVATVVTILVVAMVTCSGGIHGESDRELVGLLTRIYQKLQVRITLAFFLNNLFFLLFCVTKTHLLDHWYPVFRTSDESAHSFQS